MKIRCNYDKLVPLSELKPHPDNKNQHSEEQIERLSKILKYQGWRSPVVVSNQTGYIVAGHCRLASAKKLGWESAPVNYQDFDNHQSEYAHLQADNAIAAWADLDIGSINDDIKEFDPDFDIDMLGIENFELEPAEKKPGKEKKETKEINCPHCGAVFSPED